MRTLDVLLDLHFANRREPHLLRVIYRVIEKQA
jgi:hypothetical protein